MTSSDKDRLFQRPASPFFNASQLSIKHDGTLAYGYTCKRDTFHVYLMSGILHRVIYDANNVLLDHKSGISLCIELLVPNKRLYPEACDLNFCELIHPYFEYGLPSTYFNNDMLVSESVFFGKLLYELTAPEPLPETV